MIYLHVISLTIVFCVCMWAIFSRKVSDDLGVKLALLVMVFASVSQLFSLTKVHHFYANNGNILFSMAAAVFSLRCFWIKGLRRRWPL